MKYKSFGILNLIVIIFYVLRPALPYIEYAINKNYIEKNLCVQRTNQENTCHGKCYLHKQLKKQSETGDADRNDGNKVVKDKNMDDHIIGKITFPALFQKVVLLLECPPVSGTTTFISSIFNPPEY